MVTAIVTGALMAASVAFAAWLATGTGSGYAKAGRAQPLSTLDMSAYTAGELFPGSTGFLAIDIQNPNPYDVVVTEIRQAGDAVASGGIGDCTTSDVTIPDGALSTGLLVPAGDHVGVSIPDGVQMGLHSDDGCQGATFAIPVTLAGIQSEV